MTTKTQELYLLSPHKPDSIEDARFKDTVDKIMKTKTTHLEGTFLTITINQEDVSRDGYDISQITGSAWNHFKHHLQQALQGDVKRQIKNFVKVNGRDIRSPHGFQQDYIDTHAGNNNQQYQIRNGRAIRPNELMNEL